MLSLVPLIVLPHEAEHAWETEAVIPVRVRDENLADFGGLHGTPLDLPSCFFVFVVERIGTVFSGPDRCGARAEKKKTSKRKRRE